MGSSVAEDVAVSEDKIVVVWACGTLHVVPQDRHYGSSECVIIGAALAWMIWDTVINFDIEVSHTLRQSCATPNRRRRCNAYGSTYITAVMLLVN